MAPIPTENPNFFVQCHHGAMREIRAISEKFKSIVMILAFALIAIFTGVLVTVPNRALDVGLWEAVSSIVVCMIFYPFLWLSAAKRLFNSREATVKALKRQIGEMQAEQLSDMKLTLQDGVAIVSVGVGVAKDGYAISVENKGSRTLGDCQLFWRSSRPGISLEEAEFIPSSHPFSLRLGDPKTFNIIWVEQGKGEDSYGEPSTYWSGLSTDANYAQPILPIGDYDFAIKAVSADTRLAYMVMRFWHDGKEWHLETKANTR